MKLRLTIFIATLTAGSGVAFEPAAGAGWEIDGDACDALPASDRPSWVDRYRTSVRQWASRFGHSASPAESWTAESWTAESCDDACDAGLIEEWNAAQPAVAPEVFLRPPAVVPDVTPSAIPSPIISHPTPPPKRTSTPRVVPPIEPSPFAVQPPPIEPGPSSTRPSPPASAAPEVPVGYPPAELADPFGEPDPRSDRTAVEPSPTGPPPIDAVPEAIDADGSIDAADDEIKVDGIKVDEMNVDEMNVDEIEVDGSWFEGINPIGRRTIEDDPMPSRHGVGVSRSRVTPRRTSRRGQRPARVSINRR